MDIKPGDVVQLKSGGPLMTVVEISNGEAFCIWFSSAEELQRERFPITSLKKLDRAT